uniref:START domain-containing protein n=1 Tax=Globisporangium ultimum (strain ATCC 200006 / CBS 805.95 / DAOM BR144) TaxID=431595 RepID=K3X118_GLOUD
MSAPSPESHASSQRLEDDSSVSSSTSFATTAAAYTHSLHHASHAHPLPPATAIRSFPKIELTHEEHAHYDRVVGRLLYRCVQEYAKYAANGAIDRGAWAPVRRNRDMAIFRNLKGTGNPRVTLMLGIGKIHGSLEDVMDGLYSDHTEELRAVMTFLKSKFITGSIMQVSERRTPDDPFNFAGIKWFAAKTPGGAVSYDRDLLTYERQGMTFDADGNEIGYHLLQSVDRPEWPANTFKSLIRAHASTCYIYKRKSSRVVETFFWGEFYGSGSFPQRISDYGIAGKWLTVVNSVKCSHARKLSQLKQKARARSSSATASTASSASVAEASDRKCLTVVAKQRGSKINWDGVEAEQPPAYFDYVFQLSGVRERLDSETSSTWSTNRSDTTWVDTPSFVESSMRKLGLRGDDEASIANSDNEADLTELDEEFARRRQSHADRIGTREYNKELLMEELYANGTSPDGETPI